VLYEQVNICHPVALGMMDFGLKVTKVCTSGIHLAGAASQLHFASTLNRLKAEGPQISPSNLTSLGRAG
jgi:hypothetical protein